MVFCNQKTGNSFDSVRMFNVLGFPRKERQRNEGANGDAIKKSSL